jgi:hypothetical protein
MLGTQPHRGDPAIRVALVAALTALHAAGLASQIRGQRSGLPTSPARTRETTP